MREKAWATSRASQRVIDPRSLSPARWGSPCHNATDLQRWVRQVAHRRPASSAVAQVLHRWWLQDQASHLKVLRGSSDQNQVQLKAQLLTPIWIPSLQQLAQTQGRKYQEWHREIATTPQHSRYSQELLQPDGLEGWGSARFPIWLAIVTKAEQCTQQGFHQRLEMSFPFFTVCQ